MQILLSVFTLLISAINLFLLVTVVIALMKIIDQSTESKKIHTTVKKPSHTIDLPIMNRPDYSDLIMYQKPSKDLTIIEQE